MARLPKVGDDKGTWGTILNDYLSQSHNGDGTLRTDSVGAPQIKPLSVTGAAIANGAVSAAKLASSAEPTDGQALTYDDGGLVWATVSGSGTVPDATESEKGLVRLAGDLAGTANDPSIAEGVIGTAKLADDAVTSSKLAAGAVTNASVADTAAIGMSKIAGLTSALTDKANASDVSAKADDNAVVHLSGSQTISGDKDFTGELTQDGNAIVTTVDGRLTNQRVPVDGSVTAAKIQDDAVDTSKLSPVLRQKLSTVPTPSFRTIDPRSYLGDDETWDQVADIRAAFQEALDQAHEWAMAGDSVEFLIPAGVGKLTSTCAAERRPVNRASGTKGRYRPQMGFGLRVNLPGHITFRGLGGYSRDSVIQLSENCVQLFFVDSDSGVNWVSMGESITVGGVTTLWERPDVPVLLRNYSFEGFAIDGNETAVCGHVLIGSVIPTGTNTSFFDQMYVSAQALRFRDIDLFGYSWSETISAEGSTPRRYNALVWFASRPGTAYEAANLAGDPHNIWRRWDLASTAGRTDAHAARWIWFYDIEADHLRSRNTQMLFLVFSTVGRATSVWMDEVHVKNLHHWQEGIYSNWSLGTGLYLGGSIVGGRATIDNYVDHGMGDDGIEAGGWDSLVIENFTGINANRSNLFIRQSQRPLHPGSSRVVIKNYRSITTGAAIKAGSAGSWAGLPLQMELDADRNGKTWPVGELVLENVSHTVDGLWHDESGNAQYADGNLLQTALTGWATNWAAHRIVIRGLQSTWRNLSYQLGSGSRSLIALTSGQPEIVWNVRDVLAVAENITSTGVAVTLRGLDLPSARSVAVDGVDVRLRGGRGAIGIIQGVVVGNLRNDYDAFDLGTTLIRNVIVTADEPVGEVAGVKQVNTRPIVAAYAEDVNTLGAQSTNTGGAILTTAGENLSKFTYTRAYGPTPVVVDDFNRASLGPNWVGSGHDIVNNKLTRTGGSDYQIIRYATARSSANHFASIWIDDIGTNGDIGPVVRFVDTSNYVCARVVGTTVSIVKVIGGTLTQLAQVTGKWTGVGRLRLNANGDTYTVFRDSTQILQVATAIPELASAAHTGIRDRLAGPPVMDDFTTGVL